jgi:hypothetical protein
MRRREPESTLSILVEDYLRGLRVAGAVSLNGFKGLLVRLVELLLPMAELSELVSLPFDILLEDDLANFLMEPKKELLLVVPEFEDILVQR